MSFAFTGLWVLVGSYSVLLAIVFTPPMLLLWYVSGKSRTLGLLFAVAVGASIYVHPLLAISFGLLWLVGLLRRRDLRPSQLAQELFAMASVSVFYWYGLLFADAGYIAPYQLTKAFMYTVIAGSKFGPVFFIIAIIVALAATFASRIFSTKSQILFWFTAGLYGLMQLNHFTDLVDFLNRYQISRLNFFVAVALLFVAADFLTKTVARVPSVFTYCLLGLAVGIGLSQTLIDGSMYGFSPSASVPDPVGAFENTQHGPLNGSIYIYSSISSAYYHPGLRYSNGYNDQLLPQLLNDRLNGLLSQISPTYDVTDTDVSNISAYVKVLGIGYIFLPPNSAYIQPLLSSGNFKLAAHVTSTQFDYVILKPTWPIVNAFTVNSVQEKFTASEVIPAVTSTDDAAYAQLDLATQQLAAIEYNPASTPVALSWPAPDQLRVTFPPSRSDHYVFVNQSYSRDWHATGATAIKRASVGLMILAVPAGVTSVELQHTWGLLPVIQLVLGLIVLCIIGWSIIRRSKHA
jgi:hypothetical protein